MAKRHLKHIYESSWAT